MSQVEAAVVEDHVVEALLTDADVTDSEVSFEDLMHPTVPDTMQSGSGSIILTEVIL